MKFLEIYYFLFNLFSISNEKMIVVIVAVQVGSMYSTVQSKYKSPGSVGAVSLIYVVASCFLKQLATIELTVGRIIVFIQICNSFYL